MQSVKEYAPQDTELHRIVEVLQAVQQNSFYKLIATAKQRGHYMHSGCMHVSVGNSDDPYRYLGDSEDTIAEMLRAYADKIYKQLENEYDFCNSDGVIIDTLIDNEYEFTEDGKPS